MAQPNNPAPEPPESTVSGLDEKQIDAADLRALHAAALLHQAQLDTTASCHVLLDAVAAPQVQPELRTVQLNLLPPRTLKLRIAPLPHAATLRRMKWDSARLRTRQALALALQQPILRQRVLPGDMPREELKALLKAMYVKYGEAARALEVDTVFRHIPPESAGQIQIDPSFRWAAFSLPAGTPPHKAQRDYHLVILREANGETRKVLFRL